MESNDNQTTNKQSKDLFDYSNVVTFAAGEGSNRQYFTFDEPRLCRESTYFEDRLHGDYPEARTRHFDFKDVDPAALACMLCWYRGWSCVSCEEDVTHINATLLLAEKCHIPRFKEHLARKIEARASVMNVDREQRGRSSWHCGDKEARVLATDRTTGQESRPDSRSNHEKKAA